MFSLAFHFKEAHNSFSLNMNIFWVSVGEWFSSLLNIDNKKRLHPFLSLPEFRNPNFVILVS